MVNKQGCFIVLKPSKLIVAPFEFGGKIATTMNHIHFVNPVQNKEKMSKRRACTTSNRRRPGPPKKSSENRTVLGRTLADRDDHRGVPSVRSDQRCPEKFSESLPNQQLVSNLLTPLPYRSRGFRERRPE